MPFTTRAESFEFPYYSILFQVTIEFENYGPHVKYVEFEHSGKDTQFWAGYYGSKMAGGVVKVALPISSSS